MSFDLVVATAPRTGGNWLMRLFAAKGIATGGEWQHPGNEKKAAKALQKSRDRGIPFINKVHADEMWEYDLTLEDLIPGDRPVKYLHLIRGDVYAQAESWLGARQTGNWFHGSTRGIVQPSIQHMNALIEMEDFWDDILPPHPHLFYENLRDNTNNTMDSIMTWLSV